MAFRTSWRRAIVASSASASALLLGAYSRPVLQDSASIKQFLDDTEEKDDLLVLTRHISNSESIPAFREAAVANREVLLATSTDLPSRNSFVPDSFKQHHIRGIGYSLYLRDRCKTIHFIRHAEGFHNQATRESGGDHSVLEGGRESHPLWDARLTKEGKKQCGRLRDELSLRYRVHDPDMEVDLVVVSPLTRTLETAEMCFGPSGAPGAPKFLAREECRERWGKYVCDGRRSISQIRREFPHIDFSEVQQDLDVHWSEEREPDPECCARGVRFLQWLEQRPEKVIVVVTHSSFLRHLFQQFGGDTDIKDRDELRRLAGNCELRTVILASHGGNPEK